MTIEVPITRKERNQIRRVLRNEAEVICLDEASFIKTTLVAMEMLQCGSYPVAKVTRRVSEATR
jgi:hypothetical protein